MKIPETEIICGDCLDVMQGMESGSFDAVLFETT